MSILLVTLVSEGLVLENYLSAFPRIAEDKDAELKAQNTSYLEDYAVQGKMAVLLFNEYDEMGNRERLEAVKEQLKFVSVTLIDKEGNIIGTTDQALRKVLTKEENEIFLKKKGTMLHWGDEEMALLPDRKDTVVECRALLNENSESLILEYDYSSMSEISNQYGTWQSILERMLSGLEGYALLVGSGEDEFTVYPADDISEKNYNELEIWFRRMLDKEKPVVFSHSNRGGVNSFSAAMINDQVCFHAFTPCWLCFLAWEIPRITVIHKRSQLPMKLLTAMILQRGSRRSFLISILCVQMP